MFISSLSTHSLTSNAQKNRLTPPQQREGLTFGSEVEPVLAAIKENFPELVPHIRSGIKDLELVPDPNNLRGKLIYSRQKKYSVLFTIFILI